MRVPARGLAFQELVATRAGAQALGLLLADGTRESKLFVAGVKPERRMQPERVQSFWASMIWPAEPAFASGSPLAKVYFEYPDRDLGWLPGSGPFAVLLTFILASMAFGFLVMKPLGVQI